MWEQKDYSFVGDHFSVPTPHNILPKPYGDGHPPIWVACGNPETFAKAANHGIGAIAFNFEPIHNLKGRVQAYKEAIAHPADQIGQYKNDNVMMTNAVICLKDRERAREIAKKRSGYRVTMVNLYHDTMPKSPDAIVWPQPPAKREWTDEMLDWAIQGGYMLCGNPEEVCEQLKAYQDVGCDQVAFGVPDEGFQHDEVLEMIEIFGNEVIPEFDRDPQHSTTRYRRSAQRRYPDFAEPIPAGLDIAEPPIFPISV
jgi:alkanesulfonate monooxygenase SsuD/methylene tetrahydromethanopterin reductase-like flavin-dependent oxidoreductase (luciferase family)